MLIVKEKSRSVKKMIVKLARSRLLRDCEVIQSSEGRK